jgi:hypothetical protein
MDLPFTFGAKKPEKIQMRCGEFLSVLVQFPRRVDVRLFFHVVGE